MAVWKYEQGNTYFRDHLVTIALTDCYELELNI